MAKLAPSTIRVKTTKYSMVSILMGGGGGGGVLEARFTQRYSTD